MEPKQGKAPRQYVAIRVYARTQDRARRLENEVARLKRAVRNAEASTSEAHARRERMADTVAAQADRIRHLERQVGTLRTITSAQAARLTGRGAA